MTPCFYCGEPATEMDHVPPTSLVRSRKLIDLHYMNKPQIEVPACHWCNSTLGDAPILDLETRRRLIRDRKAVKSL